MTETLSEKITRLTVPSETEDFSEEFKLALDIVVELAQTLEKFAPMSEIAAQSVSRAENFIFLINDRMQAKLEQKIAELKPPSRTPKPPKTRDIWV